MRFERKVWRSARGFLVAGAACLGLAISWPLAAAELLPHSAIYALTLAKDQANFGAVVDARGKLQFEWEGVCDGWLVRQRAQIIITHKDDSEVSFGWSLNSWESNDGLSYRFFIRRFMADGTEEEIRGSARLEADGSGGEADFTAPEARSFELPGGTIFPTRHSVDVIDAMKAGEVPLWRVVFDGSGEEGLYGINVVLARDLPDDMPASIAAPMLDGLESWRVGVAYFGMEDSASEPEFEQEMRLFDNGVVDQLLLDYGDFTLDATLADIEQLAAPDC